MFNYEPFEIIEKRIQTCYPGLFSENQVSAHKTHHKNYDKLLQNLIRKEHGLDKSLPELMHLIRSHNSCATQYWYHTMFWDNLSTHKSTPGPKTLELIEKSYGGLEYLKSCFLGTIGEHFSNGWYVLGFHRHYTPALRCMTFSDGISPMMHNIYPLLVIDLWQHSYYCDYPANRSLYAQKIWEYLNWNVVEDRLIHQQKYMKAMENYWL